MYEFMLVVGAIVVAQLVIVAIGMAVFMNKRFMKWYTQKAVEMTREITSEMVDLYEEKGLL